MVDILQMHFHESKIVCFDCNFTEVCSQMSNQREVNTDSGNKRRAITWFNAYLIHWHAAALTFVFVNIGSGNGLSSVRHQARNQINADQ